MPNGRRRLFRHQPARLRPPIPGGIEPKDFMELTCILNGILRDIETELERAGATNVQRPKEVHVRLNETGKEHPLPIFVGWVEADDVKRTRLEWNHPDPGLYRFGDDVYSEIYGEAFYYARHRVTKEHFRHRDWSKELRDKRSAEKAIDPKAGNTYQTCLAIVITEGRNRYRCVGTLVVGFLKEPPSKLLNIAHGIMRQWARQPNTTNQRRSLIDLLNRYELGGPTFP